LAAADTTDGQERRRPGLPAARGPAQLVVRAAAQKTAYGVIAVAVKNTGPSKSAGQVD
jgi:hypothetical protein